MPEIDIQDKMKCKKCDFFEKSSEKLTNTHQTESLSELESD